MDNQDRKLKTDLTTAELEQLLLQRKEEDRKNRENNRKAYEDLKAKTVIELCKEAKKLQDDLARFKIRTFSNLQTLYKMLQEYSHRHQDGKGNFSLEYENYKVNYIKQGKSTFDERADQAEKHIIDFVNSKFKDDTDTKDLIMSLLERKKGDLDVNLIQKLYQMEDRFNDENWHAGIKLLKESYHYTHSKDYVRYQQKDENGQWQSINLQFSNIPIK